MEYIEIVNENNELTGEIKEKNDVHKLGKYHRIVHLYIVNNKNQILLQRRSKTKSTYPNCLDTSVGGHVQVGETPKQALIREAYEELGLKIENEPLKFLGIVKRNNENNNEFQYVFFMKKDIKEKDCQFSDSEVSEVKYLPFEEFKNLFKNKSSRITYSSRINVFIYKYLFQIIFSKQNYLCGST